MARTYGSQLTAVLLSVFGSVDKQYLAQADGDRAKRQAIGVYEQSGLSGYVSPPFLSIRRPTRFTPLTDPPISPFQTVPQGVNPKNNTVVVGPQGPGFPVEW